MEIVKSDIVKASGAVLGAAVLATSGVAAAIPAFAQESPDSAPVAQEAVLQGGVEKAPVKVEGTFGFSQDAVTSNKTFSEVFMRAVASACASMPEYEVQGNLDLSVSVDGNQKIEATVGELAEEQGVAGALMACACASNIPGGGAVANAGASGVSLESVAQAVGAVA